MEPAIGFCIRDHSVTNFIFLVRPGKIRLTAFRKVIFIDEVIAHVVERINIDELDLAELP